ncbi:patatin-like phospholipase family protein [Telmatospirillum sp. J64-1]|uniref:patatin-like phospholipase family protein n=1 Tax=Telmatospirillum sp. J64-1 TaxID=2502183 RepID=UPI002102DAF9|nr:patatin-like phospholipase family protein [Telmatospirillum sp. J64-1]
MAEQKTIELALQGGGAHGAFTWGVLDRLLADERIRIEGLSGTSAGAMNAVVLADGLERGGREGGSKALASFWRAVSDAARFSPVQRTPLDVFMGRWSLDYSPGYMMMDMLTRMVSPYEMNPLDANPLRDIVAAQVDFDRVNRCRSAKVFVTATNVETGKARIFRQPELSVDTIMASACLPFLYKAVEIDGGYYWDGGYMGNPALYPLVDECDARDLIIVQINPFFRKGPPRSAPDITNRLNEITFNSSLIKELRMIALFKQLIEAEGLEHERYRDMLIHRIHAADDLEHLRVSSKLNAEWDFLRYLHDIGWRTTEDWLDRNFDKLGRESTFDLDILFDDSFRPLDLSRGKRQGKSPSVQPKQVGPKQAEKKS